MRWLIFSILPIFFFGCADKSVLNVIGGCELPAQYDYVAPGPVDLQKGITAKQHTAAEAAERSAHRTLAKDYNGVVGYVKGKC
jgi:hypothetical protein